MKQPSSNEENDHIRTGSPLRSIHLLRFTQRSGVTTVFLPPHTRVRARK